MEGKLIVGNVILIFFLLAFASKIIHDMIYGEIILTHRMQKNICYMPIVDMHLYFEPHVNNWSEMQIQSNLGILDFICVFV